MAIRANHYDRAFEEFLRVERRPHVVVDEARRALLGDGSLKSLDFIVHGAAGNLLVDVKGRRFPSGGSKSGHCWENWATADDLESLARWREVFGGNARGLLVFAYEVVSPRHEHRFEVLFDFRGRRYAFFGVWADEYARARRTRSPKWGTVGLPRSEFRRFRRPIGEFLEGCPSTAEPAAV